MRLSLIAALAALLSGCEKVVAVDLPEGPKKLVVEARLERVQGRVSGVQEIRLTTTDSYYSRSAPPAAIGALVRVTDDLGVTVPFAASATPGVYTTSALTLDSLRTYTLRIDWQGEQYQATARLASVSAIDSLYFAGPGANALGPDTGQRATINSRDPAGVRNWYLWEQIVDGVRLVGPDSSTRARVTGSDDAFAGRVVIRLQPFDGWVIRRGATVLVRQIGLSEEVFRYYTALNEQTTSGGTPFDVPLASVRGNVLNLTNPVRGALGYFLVSEVSERQAVRP